MPWVADTDAPKKGWVADAPKPSTIKDMALSGLTGLAQGIAQTGGMIGDLKKAAISAPLQTGLKVASMATGKDTRAIQRGVGAAVNAAPFKSTEQLESARKGAGLDYSPKTRAGKYARTVGQFAVNAAAPGSAPARVASVVIPAAMSEAAGQMTEGKSYEGAARIGGAMLGGVGVAVATSPNIAAPIRNAFQQRAEPLNAAANALRRRTDVAAVQAQVDDLRANGAVPTFASATDEGGRGFVRAAASRNTPAREVVQRRAETSALNMPDRVGMQARRVMSNDPRNPRQIASELATARRTNADAAFGAVRGDVIDMAPDTVQALRNPMGKEAIAEAARRERDPQIRAALNRLANDALDAPSTPITVGMADRISRTLYGRAQAAARGGDNDLAATFSQLADSVRNPARAASRGYGQALSGYADESRVMDAAEQGGDFLKRNTDEFAAEVAGPGQPGNDLARATARRAVEQAAGENTASAPGVARRIANAPEQQARNRALLGEQDAARLEAGMRAEAKTNADLQFVAPNTGSQTQLRTADQEGLGRAVGLIEDLAGGPRRWVGMVAERLKTIGLSDEQAAAVADIATDPAQLNDLMARLARQPGGSQWVPVIRETVINARRAAITGPAYSAPAVIAAQPRN